MVNHRRIMDIVDFRLRWEQTRVIAFYGSQWLNHKGKTANDLFPLPWEGEQRVALTPEKGMEAALELQKMLKKKNATTEAGTS